MLLHKILHTGIDGKFYFTLKALYESTKSCVEVNGNKTEWFDTVLGVRQGDSLSPSLFSIFINDMAKDVKDMNMGVDIGNLKISICYMQMT